ncbi:hypothetical protein QOT17_023999 [Balamuthia mandrillaris]
MTAATALTSVLFLVLMVSVASAKTGYFETGAAGLNPSCTQSEPCADPFAYLSNNTFDEYVLASGDYTVDSRVVLTKSFTLRKWRARDENEPVVLTSFDSKLFYLDMQQPLTGLVSWSFHDIIMQCSNGYAIDMFDGGDGHAHLELHNVTIRNSAGGVIVWNLLLETNNLIISNISCQSGEPLCVLYSNWTFTDVTLLGNCLGGDYVSVAYVAGTEAISSGGSLVFSNNRGSSDGAVLDIQGSTFVLDRTHVSFFNNTASIGSLVLLSGSEWRSTGQILFQSNSAGSLIQTASGSGFQSLLPLQMFDDVLSNPDAPFDLEESTYFCAIPCNGSECDCNHLPLVSWNVTSELLYLTSSEGTLVFPLVIDPPAPSSFHVPLLLELTDGLLYPQHFTIQPLPSTTTATTLNVTLEISQNSSHAELAITKKPALSQLATVAFYPATTLLGSAVNFFSSVHLQLTMAPFIPLTNRTVYQPEQSEMSVSFPNNNKPDHTLTLHDPQDNHPLANYSITALFATLMEVDQEGEPVSMVSLQDTDFLMEELGNTSFNLNHAVPFISFSADIASFTSVGTGKKVNLTENMKMEVNFTMFAEEQEIEFADVEQVMTANTLKWSLFLSSWPFQHRNHSLQLHLSLSSQDGPIAEGVEEVEENGVLSFVLRTENTEIPINVLPLALLHGSQGERAEVGAEWRGMEQEMVVQLPWFEHSLLLDPDMSLLVGEAEEEGKEKDENDGLWWKIVVPVVVVLVVAVVVMIAVVGVTMLKRRSKQRRVKVANKLKSGSCEENFS